MDNAGALETTITEKYYQEFYGMTQYVLLFKVVQSIAMSLSRLFNILILRLHV